MIFEGVFSDDLYFEENEERESRFVFIGKNLDRDMLIKGFEACKAEENLRFQIGDQVKVKKDKWQNGTVIKLWDEGNPYRILIDDVKGNKKQREVFATIDSDEVIRARD